MLPLGIASRAHGVRGEIRILTELDPRYLKEVTAVVVGGREYKVERARFAGGAALIKLEGVDDRDAADALRGEIYLSDSVKISLPKDEFFIDDLIGCRVRIEGDESYSGEIYDVLRNGAADVWCVRGEGGSPGFMMPQVKGVVKEYALDDKLVVLDKLKLAEVAVYED